MIRYLLYPDLARDRACPYCGSPTNHPDSIHARVKCPRCSRCLSHEQLLYEDAMAAVDRRPDGCSIRRCGGWSASVAHWDFDGPLLILIGLTFSVVIVCLAAQFKGGALATIGMLLFCISIAAAGVYRTFTSDVVTIDDNTVTVTRHCLRWRWSRHFARSMIHAVALECRRHGKGRHYVLAIRGCGRSATIGPAPRRRLEWLQIVLTDKLYGTLPALPPKDYLP